MADRTTEPFEPPLPQDWARGIDVSKWQQGLDWAAVAQAGFAFAFVKATEGDDYTDPTFQTHWQAARDHGLLRGPYHLFWPEDDHQQQADLFVKTVRRLELDDLPPILDVEARADAPAFPNEQWLAGVQVWLNTIEAGLGRRPIIYTSAEQWKHLRDAAGRPPTWTARYPLWVAHWDAAQPALPDGWGSWLFWQYKADHVPGFDRLVDYDVFRGSADDLRQWLVGTASGPSPRPALRRRSPVTPTFPLKVAYISQLEADGSGHDNCGPACLTMALSSIGQITATAEPQLRETMHQIAAELKGADWSTPVFTDYGDMARYLGQRGIAHRAAQTWQEVEQTLDAAQPIILRLWNGALEPYSYGSGSGWISKHFIVLLGYTDTHFYAADPLTYPQTELVKYTRESVRRAVAQLGRDRRLTFEVDAFVVGDPPTIASVLPLGLIDPTASKVARDQLQAYFEMYLRHHGQGVNMDTAIMKAAALAYRRGETRGPALSDEYKVRLDNGDIVIRQDFTAGVIQYDPRTGQALWLEVILHPEELKREHIVVPPAERDSRPPVRWRAPRAGFAYAEGGQLRLDDQPFRFLGVNVRELLHYGNHAVNEHCNVEHIGQQLDAARRMGSRVARVFVAHRAYNPDTIAAEVGDRLAAVLDTACGPADAMRPDAVRLLVAFTDYNKGRGYYPRDDEGFFNRAGFLEGRGWYAGQWRTHYWPLVEAMIRRFKDDPRIFAWEVGNELKLPADPGVFLDFMSLVTAEIRRLDPSHLVGAGIISTFHCAFDPLQASQFYANPNLDFATLHLAGGGENFPHLSALPGFRGDPDEGRRRAYIDHQVGLAQATGKPLIVEEAGYPPRDMTRLTDLAAFTFASGAVGFLPWGFSGFSDRADRDVGDNLFGMGNYPPFFDAGLFERVVSDLLALAAKRLGASDARRRRGPANRPRRPGGRTPRSG